MRLKQQGLRSERPSPGLCCFMKKILTPIDFSSATARVIEKTAELAQAYGGSVVLLHVVRLPHTATGFDLETRTMVELGEALERSADEQLAEFRRGLQAKGIVAESLRLDGQPAQLILEQAEKLPADFIVIGSHGHTAFYDLIVGSTASAVLKRATCPVMIVPPGKGEARGRGASSRKVQDSELVQR